MTSTYAGMDAHAATIWVAVLAPGAERPEEWQLTNEPRSVKRLAERLKRAAAGPVVACYEAGRGGFALQRQLEAAGVECRVIAPALIPRRPGDRVKTDRRDARKLAELLRADLLTVVHPPTPDQEAVRDLCRAREDAVADRMRARHRLVRVRTPSSYSFKRSHRLLPSISSTGGAPSRLASARAPRVNVPVVTSSPFSPLPAMAPRKSRIAPAWTCPL